MFLQLATKNYLKYNIILILLFVFPIKALRIVPVSSYKEAEALVFDDREGKAIQAFETTTILILSVSPKRANCSLLVIFY